MLFVGILGIGFFVLEVLVEVEVCLFVVKLEVVLKVVVFGGLDVFVLRVGFEEGGFVEE